MSGDSGLETAAVHREGSCLGLRLALRIEFLPSGSRVHFDIRHYHTQKSETSLPTDDNTLHVKPVWASTDARESIPAPCDRLIVSAVSGSLTRWNSRNLTRREQVAPYDKERCEVAKQWTDDGYQASAWTCVRAWGVRGQRGAARASR